MAENLLTDARVRSASFERDGAYLRDGGGLRIRLLPPSGKNPRGVRLAGYDFKLQRPDGTTLSTTMPLGTLGAPFKDASGKIRPFGLADARVARDAARVLVAQGVDPREADRLAKLEQVEAHRNRLAELDTRRTVADAFRLWMDLYVSARGKDGVFAHRKDGGAFVLAHFERHVLPKIGALPLDGIKREQITDVLDAITAQGRLRTANMTLSLLRQFLRWCLGRWIKTDPTLGISKAIVGGKEKPRERTLSLLEIVELRDKLPAAELPERIERAVWVLLATGARVGELAAAKAENIDLDAREWFIPTTKSGRPHLVHLSDFAARHFRRMLELRGESVYLLPGRTSDDQDRPISDKVITKMLGDRQRTVPLKGRTKHTSTLLLARGKWTPHDLRRSMASRMRGTLCISSDVIEKCLNHQPQQLVGTYQTDELLAERKAAFEAWGAELDRLMAADVSNVIAMPRATA
jgi:integrase